MHLAVRDDTEVLYVDRLSWRASVPIMSTIRSRLPMHSTGVGKVLLAHAPPAVQAEVLQHLTRITPYTLTQPGSLRRQLERVLKDDYATTVEEMSLGACSVTVPIRAGRRRRVTGHRAAQSKVGQGQAGHGLAGDRSQHWSRLDRPGHVGGSLSLSTGSGWWMRTSTSSTGIAEADSRSRA